MKINLKDRLNEMYPIIKSGALLNAGNIDNCNSMVIGWLTLGVLWSKKVVFVFVKPCRYTHDFMEKNEYFTISCFEDEYNKNVNYFGTHSGKDVDKYRESGLTLIKYDDDTITFKEAIETVKFKKIYSDELDNDVVKEIKDTYYSIDKEHTMYVGLLVE